MDTAVRLGVAPGGQHLAVGAEAHGSHGFRVALEGCDLAPARNVPLNCRSSLNMYASKNHLIEGGGVKIMYHK
jgi:hypothetical protein